MSNSMEQKHRLATYSLFYATVSLSLLCLIGGGQLCQAQEGDELFETPHQDLGRISGLPSGVSHVATHTNAAVSRQPQQPAASPLHQTLSAGHSGSSSDDQQHSRRTQEQNTAGVRRKPNRVTLVARRDPLTTQQLAAAQLPAPPSQYAPAQTAPSSSFNPSQTTFSPQESSEHQQHQHHAQTLAPVSSLAPSSFRATDSLVSSRHSALIAQVSSERAAEASLVSPQSEPAPAAPLPAHSFGSLSASSSLSQVHDHHGQQQQPAFASFAASQTAASHHSQHRQVAPEQLQLNFSPSQPQAAVNQAEEPLVAPSFEHVLGHGCPHKGVFSWENKDHCDRYYMCTNGTFTEEACPNGLAYSQLGAVYQHCAYNWNVQCGNKKTAQPLASPGCPWQFGIFPILQNGRCSIDYFVCEWGVPETKRCQPEGLFYDDRIKGCQWADQLGCKSEALLNFKCPAEDEDNPYWPYPRYFHSNQDVIVCVNEQPRLVHCNEDQLVDPGSLACIDVNKKKKKKPF